MRRARPRGMMVAERCQRSGWRRVEDQIGIRRRGGGQAEVANAPRCYARKRRVDHFGRGLQVAADRCNSSAISRVSPFSNGETAENDQYRRHFLSLPFPLASPGLMSLPLPSCSRSLFRLPRCSLLLHLSLPSFRLFSIPFNVRRLRTSRRRRHRSRFSVPSLILRAVSLRFPPARPPPSPAAPPANPPPNPPPDPPRILLGVLRAY